MKQKLPILLEGIVRLSGKDALAFAGQHASEWSKVGIP